MEITSKFTTQLRVRHYEMDALGHVNNAVYQHYLEQAAIEHSEQVGFTLDRYEELGGAFVLRRMAIEYLRPAVAGDRLTVATWLENMRGTRVTRHYEIYGKDQALLVTAEALWVWVDRTSMRPRPIPADLSHAFNALQQTEITA
ncbi:MAG: acyl-CoA thioesterase [Leptolyngbyaceae cyanobacterium SM1_3_5]|nr:acyl-CoA thioesterase [Leptolyngbyaceae cyanobacterium SM1_3_5]